MSEEEAIQRHLKYSPSTSDIQFFSGFVAALRDARQATGRDPDTRVKLGPSFGSWLGTLGYMALLDQIGSCFKPKTVAIEHRNSITRALKYFSNLSADEIDAIYALRCAFAHHYSLYNIRKNKKSLQHRFAVGVGNMPLIVFPKVPWDGDYNSQNRDNVTWVNLEAFGDLVESIYQKIVRLAQDRQLEIVLDGGSDELIRRYSFFTPIT